MARDSRRHDTDPEFGALLYEKDLSLTPTGLSVRGLMAGLVAVIGAGAVVGGLQDGEWGPALFGVAMIVVGPAAWYFLAYRVRLNRFRFFRRGLEQTTRAGPRRLAYSDVAVFTYNASRVTVNWVYSHTDVLMEFRPDVGDRVVYHSQDRDERDHLADVREAVSEAVADRLAREAGAGAAVEWCEGLRFVPDGLEVAAPVVFGKPKYALVPYDRFARVTFREGHCRVYAADNDEPVFERQVLLPNFFPGLVHLGRRTGGRLLTR